MITLTKSGNAIVFTFDDNDHYLNDGTIEVPVNSLTLVTDDSQMATFRKSASNDIFISATYDELGMSKADLESWFKENACGSTGGSVTPEEVQTMIDESISGKADTSDVQEIASDVSTVSGDVNTLSGSVNALTGAVNTLSGDVSTLSGSVDSNHNAITAVVGDVQTLSGQVETDEKVTANALVDLDNRKLDASAYTPTDLSNYYTKSQTNTQINNATEGLLNASTFNSYSASTEARISENEEVTSAALNALDEKKLDASAYTPTDLSNYYTKSETSGATQISTALEGKADIEDIPTNVSAFNNDAGYVTQTNIDAAVSGKVNTTDFNTYSASTDNRLSEDEEVTAAGLNALNDALSGKQDTLSAGTNITISGNVISAEGGGKAIEAGRGIAITTGATADTVSFNLPISSSTETLLLTDSSNNISSTNSVVVIGASNNVSSSTSSRPTVKSIILGFSNEIVSTSFSEAGREKNYIIGNNNSVRGDKNVVIGANNIGYNSTTKASKSSYIVGNSNSLNYGDVIDKENNYIFGSNNKVRNSNEVSIGYYNNSVSDGTTSGNTFFSVGNGTADNARHNALEIRQNGDVYFPDTDNTTYQNFYEKPMVRLQDVYGALGGLKLVQISQSDYDNLQNKDASTLYIITNNS